MPFARVHATVQCGTCQALVWLHVHTLTGTESKHVLLIDIKDILNVVDN